ncbi:MAG: hydroxylamine reductase [Candidatus Bathyarchaeota archaeon]|nr:MAG: hydroxylamine reductase [Candidatus Bathyarchaeota archaeon]
MYCNQCEQTARGVACTIQGVCGKKSEVAALQDLLIHSLKGLSILAVHAQKQGIVDSEVNQFVVKAAFATLTNVNFDPARFVELVHQAVKLRRILYSKIKTDVQLEKHEEQIVNFEPAASLELLIQQGENVGLQADVSENPDVQSLHQIILFGIKGVAAYTYHALLLGQQDEGVFQFIYRALAAIVNPALTAEELTALALECGKTNLRAMELLDVANTSTYGHPVPTTVPLGVKRGKAILVSGHDLLDLEQILKQTEGEGVFVYTHGEMLPTHAYPKLKKYAHFYGHYGTAWQNQQREFAEFPGAIVMTTNCLQKPRDSYKDNLFTTGIVGWPEITHLTDSDFTPAIQKALELPGFPEDVLGKTVTVGFGHKTVLSIAEQIIAAVKNKEIRHFFLVAGCDGAKPGRNYYTEFVEQVPKDSIVLTLACGKFRFFDQELGEISGIPRLIDVGQCNDAYSAVQIAVALANAFNVGVNDLPLSLILSWYEQKAVAILLSLLHLGIRDIRLGPSLPAFITPNILNVLVDNFNITPITTPEQDLQSILGKNS